MYYFNNEPRGFEGGELVLFDQITHDDGTVEVAETFQVVEPVDNTIVFFTSDNGPEGRKQTGRTPGSTGGLRGRKRDSGAPHERLAEAVKSEKDRLTTPCSRSRANVASATSKRTVKPTVDAAVA